MSRRPNQVSLKDLFTTNPGELLGARYASDSALDSASQGNSQFPFSQAEFFDSQDGQQLPHSQNLSQSPTTRFFNRYMGKGSLIGRDSSQSQIGRSYSASTVPKLPSQQQIQLLKTRTQDQDERDLWNSLVSGIRECSAEVRVAVACLKESTQLGIGSTECQLTAFVEKIQSSLEKSQSVIAETLSNQDNARTKETELQQQLAIKNGRIEELEKQIQKVMQEKQDSAITNLQATCGDLYHKITESLEPLFFHGQNALTRIETVQERHNQRILDQMKQCLQQNLLDQKESIKSLLEGFKTLANLQNENLQKQNGILTSEILKSLQSFQENQQRGLEESLIHQVKELLEKKELQQKELFEKQYQWLSAIQQEQRQEMPMFLQSEMQHSNSEQKKHFLSIIEDCMSEEKNRYSQLLKELERLNSLCHRCGKELEVDKDCDSSKPRLRDKTNVVCLEAAHLLRDINKNDFATEQPKEAHQVLSVPRKVQADADSVCVEQTKRVAHNVDIKKQPSTASSYELSVDPAPATGSFTNAKFDKDREAMAQTDLTSLNNACKENKPVIGGKLQLPEVVDAKFVSPLPSGNSRRFSGHSHICSDGKVNPSPVALVFPQVQPTKTLQVVKDSSLLVASVDRSTPRIPALQAGTTPLQFSEGKNGLFATSVSIPAVLPASVARAKAPTTRQVETSSASSMAAFANAPVTKELSCNYELQRCDSPAGLKVSKKKRRKGSLTLQRRKRARKQPVVEVRVTEGCNEVESRRLMTSSTGKNEKVPAKKPYERQSVICKALSPAAEVFDFHSDTSDESDSDFPIKRIVNRKSKLSMYSMETSEDRRMIPSNFDISKRHSARKTRDFLETYSRPVNCRSSYSTRSKSSIVGKTRALPGNSCDQENNNCIEGNPCSNEGCCSSSASSSPCWSLGDILKLSEV